MLFSLKLLKLFLLLSFKYEIRRINFDGTNETVFYGDDEILVGMESGTMQVDAVGR